MFNTQGNEILNNQILNSEKQNNQFSAWAYVSICTYPTLAFDIDYYLSLSIEN
jgi:hypothetical protein